MAANTNIEWADHTFNMWEGCTKVSPGCANCYAEARNRRFAGGANWGKGAPRRRTSAANWRQPVRWNREAPGFGVCFSCGPKTDWTREGRCPNCSRVDLWQPRRPRVFCASLADWLDDEVPIEWLADLLALIHATPNLDWLLLTKRPQNWNERGWSAWRVMDEGSDARRMVGAWLNATIPCDIPQNIWIGITVEDQARADERIPKLLQIPAKVRFLSCEPLLEPVNLAYTCFNGSDSFGTLPGIHWVICGGESGLGARPMHPQWARSLRNQCTAAGVPFFFKQWGEWADFDHPYDVCHDPRYIRKEMDQEFVDGKALNRIGKHAAGRLLDGREWNEFPA